MGIMELILGFLVFVSLGIGITALARTSRRRVAPTVSTRRLEIVNDDGVAVVAAFAGPEGGVLSVANSEGRVLSGVSAEECGGYIVVFNPQGEILSDLGLDDTGNDRVIRWSMQHGHCPPTPAL